MNKHELVSKIAEKAKLSKKDAGAVVDAFAESVASALENGDKVTLVGFGTFSVVTRKARRGRNPQTGKEINIPARKTPKFTPGKNFKTSVK
jgi:DNA-binding protein HU-beta